MERPDRRSLSPAVAAALGAAGGAMAASLLWVAAKPERAADGPLRAELAALADQRDLALRDAERAGAALEALQGGLAAARDARLGDDPAARERAVERLRAAVAALDSGGPPRAGSRGTQLARLELADLLVELGEGELAAGQAARARERFVEARALGAPGGLARARASMGAVEALRSLQQPVEEAARVAVEDTAAALRRHPSLPPARALHVRALLAAGEVGPALSEARRLSAAPGAPPEARALLAEAMARALESAPDVDAAGLLEEALPVLRARVQEAPSDRLATRALARALLRAAPAARGGAGGLLEEAAGLARRLVAEGQAGAPERVPDRALLADLLEAWGACALKQRPADARAALREAVDVTRELGPALGDGGRALGRRALGLGRLERGDDARALFEEAATCARGRLPAEPRAAADLVVALLHLGAHDQEHDRPDAARRAFDEAGAAVRAQLALTPDDAGLKRALALVLWRTSALDLASRDPEAATARLEEAVALKQALAATAPRAAAELDGLEAALEQARGRRDLLKGPPPSTPEEHLARAYAHLSFGDPAQAVERFAAAFAEPALRRDVAGGHVYQAARAAAQAGQRERALEWLAEDVKLRREAVAALEKRLADKALAADARAAATAERDRLLRHLEHARRAEPAFATLRGTPEFEALFG